jgi:hypothetical protein
MGAAKLMTPASPKFAVVRVRHFGLFVKYVYFTV